MDASANLYGYVRDTDNNLLVGVKVNSVSDILEIFPGIFVDKIFPIVFICIYKITNGLKN